MTAASPAGFRRIAVLGTGLIGGSFGLAVRKQLPEARIVGWDKEPVLRKAEAAGAIHEGSVDLDRVVAGADLVYLALPVGLTLELLPKVAATADISSVAFTPDGRSIVLGCMDSSVIVWDVAGGRDRVNTYVENASTWDVAVQPAGALFAMASQDGKIRLRELSTGRTTHTLDAHRGAARCVAFSTDGTMMATGGDDGLVKLWR